MPQPLVLLPRSHYYHCRDRHHRLVDTMRQSIVHVALVVRDYDEAIKFYTEKLNFSVVEDTYQPLQDKRWVLIAPPGSNGPSVLLGKAANAEQLRAVGNQTGGRVFLFLETDNFSRDYDRMRAANVKFVRPPKVESYGTVAVFEDLYGNRWDLVEYSNRSGLAQRMRFTGNNELALHVADPVRAAEFYRDVLGCKVVDPNPECYALDSGALRLYLLPDPAPTHEQVVPSFDVDDRAAALQELQAQGCTLVPIGPHAPGGFYVRDPFGVLFDLIQRS